MRIMFIAIALMLLAGAGLAGAEEMLTNPHLNPAEDGESPDDWRFGFYQTEAEPRYEPEGGRDGTGAAGVVVPGTSDRGQWGQGFSLDPEMTHLYIEGYYRTEGITAPDAGTIRVTWHRDDPDNRVIGDVRPRVAASDTWAHFEEIVAVPEDAVDGRIELFNFYRPGTIWWDSAHMRPATDDEVQAFMRAKLDRDPAGDEVDYSPEDGEQVAINPPAFIWLPVDGADGYVLQYAPEGDWNSDRAVTVSDWDVTVYVPHETLETGDWAWRFGIETEGELLFSTPRSFRIDDEATDFPFPRIDDVMASIPDVHPRVYYHPDEIEEIREKVRTDEDYQQLTASIINNAENRLGEELYPEPKELPPSGPERRRARQEVWRTMRPFTAGMETCAHAYILTGDERFGEEAKRRLLHFMTWDLDGLSNVFRFTEPAMDIAWRGPRTYSWIYDLLSEEERELCARILGIRIGHINELHRRRPFEARPFSSHPGRMIGFAIEGSIALAHEVPEARDILEYTLRLIWSVYPAWGNPDGGWAEGPSYWRSYIGRLAPVVQLLEDIDVPYASHPFIQNTGWFGMYTLPPGGRMRAFGDSASGSVGRGDGQLVYRLSTLTRNPYWRWYADQLDAGPGTAAGMLGFYDPTLESRPPVDIPQARLFPYIGVASMHSNMAQPSENIYLLMRSSPYGAVSHSYADQNSFVIGAFNEGLAISSGYYQLYGSPHHREWVWETKAHNSILVDGEGQMTRTPLSHGEIISFDDTDDYTYSVGDATPAYGGRLDRFLRRVLFIRPDVFVICDELVAPEPSTYQWLLHSREEMELDEAAQQVLLSSGNARLLTRFLTPEGLSFEQTSGWDPPLERDAPDQFHFTADTENPARQATFLSVLNVYREGEEDHLPETEIVEGEGGRGVLLRWDNEEALVAWRDTDAPRMTVSNMSTEAEIALIRWDAEGELTSAYSYGGVEMLVNDAPLDAALR